MAIQEKVNELQSICKQIQALEKRKHNLIERDDWGKLTFESSKDDMETAFWLANTIAKLPIHLLSEGAIQNAISSLSSIRDALNAIDVFDVATNDTSQRGDIIGQLKQGVEEVLPNLGFWLPVQALRAGETENRVAKMENIEAGMNEIYQRAAKHYETSKKEIDEIVHATRAAAGEAGAAVFTREFHDEAQKATKQAERWLRLTGVFATLALLISILSMLGMLGDAPDNTWEGVYRLGGRVIAISVLFYAAVWSGRVVLANMHLASVNKHRAVSLQTLQAFHHAAEDAVAKDAVVLEAARAVYENVPSGYIRREAAGYGASSRMAELIKNATSKASQPSN